MRIVAAVLVAFVLATCLLVALVSTSVVAWPDERPQPHCSQIRQIVERLGEAFVVSQARAQGFTDEQIAAARRACSVRQQQETRH